MDIFESAKVVLNSHDPNREPKSGDWGFCAHSDAPAPLGKGAESFYWFWKQEDLANILEEWLVYLYEPSAVVNFDQMSDTMRESTRLWMLDCVDTDELCETVNKALKDHLQLIWVGSFDQLALGKGERASAIVRRSLDLSNKDAVPNLLADGSEDRLAEFKKSLLT